jgi:hypothetical protein
VVGHVVDYFRDEGEVLARHLSGHCS